MKYKNKEKIYTKKKIIIQDNIYMVHQFIYIHGVKSQTLGPIAS